MPATAALQDSVALPEPGTLLGAIALQPSPGGVVSLRVTVPPNPFCAETVIVEAAVTAPPAFTAPGEVAAMLKSCTVNAAVVVWESVPLAPVIVTVYIPAIFELHERVAIPEPAILLGVIERHVRFAGIVSARVTVPVKPLSPVAVIVDVAEAPA